MKKVNDFYYVLEGKKELFSWREVCEWRREFGPTNIVAKILISEYEHLLTLSQTVRPELSICTT